MAQNIYDDPGFFAAYSRLNRQVHGLVGAPEWPQLRSLVRDLAGTRVLDLGCGFGWFSRWAAAEGAASVLGVDLSTNMLDRARSETTTAVVEYRQHDLETIQLPTDHFDVAFSSLAFHYVVDVHKLFSQIAASLCAGGTLVYSVEHPIYSATTTQQITSLGDGRKVWPLEDYLIEGRRSTSWLADGVQKQHRTVASYLNAMTDTGLVLDRLVEWGSTEGDERHRPWFLLVSATKA